MHSQRMGVPEGSPSDKWLSAKRRKWIPFKPALTDPDDERQLIATVIPSDLPNAPGLEN